MATELVCIALQLSAHRAPSAVDLSQDSNCFTIEHWGDMTARKNEPRIRGAPNNKAALRRAPSACPNGPDRKGERRQGEPVFQAAGCERAGCGKTGVRPANWRVPASGRSLVVRGAKTQYCRLCEPNGGSCGLSGARCGWLWRVCLQVLGCRLNLVCQASRS